MNARIIGERIKDLRINKVYLSQEDFAIKLGYDRTFVSRIESGKQNATIETLIKICNGLEVSFKDFFDFEEEQYEKN